MPQLPLISLQEAIYDLLSGDAGFSALVNGIYDNPPANAAYPYLAFGESQSQDWSTQSTTGVRSVLAMHVYSQQSRKEVITILNRLFELLQTGSITVDGHHLVMMRFEHNQVELQNDGVTYHGVMRYRTWIELEAA